MCIMLPAPGRRGLRWACRLRFVSLKVLCLTILPECETAHAMFEACKAMAGIGSLPFDDVNVDDDLQFAVEWTVQHMAC